MLPIVKKKRIEDVRKPGIHLNPGLFNDFLILEMQYYFLTKLTRPGFLDFL